MLDTTGLSVEQVVERIVAGRLGPPELAADQRMARPAAAVMAHTGPSQSDRM